MRKTKILLYIFTALILAASILTYADLIPQQIKDIPHHDSIGHFILFGALGLIAHYAFNRERVPVFGRYVSKGLTLAVVFATLEESLQVFSRTRTFDIGDLFFGIFGMLVFTAIASMVRNWNKWKFSFYVAELWFFFLKQLRSVIFAAAFLGLLFISNYIDIPFMHRYDFLFIAAIAIQILLIAFKLETKDEAKTIFLFHIIGLVLELFKTHPSVGSWSYPEPGFFKIGQVPLYSGFMYAAVGSYIAAAWKTLKLNLHNHPSYGASLILCLLIYGNFFLNHYFYDLRAFLFVGILWLYFKTDIAFTPRAKEYRMPLLLGFVLIGFFVWIAENIGTFYGAWMYPNQTHVWAVVSLQKITSWFLLVIICFIVVAYLKHFKKERLVAQSATLK
jgi:uncharacterized membrane protein YoaT (DUF817 family)